MIEYDFMYEYRLPYIYDMNYNESYEGIFSALFNYINYSILDTYRNETELFVSLRSDGDMFPHHPSIMVDRLYKDAGERQISPVFFRNVRGLYDNSYIYQNLEVEDRIGFYVDSEKHFIPDLLPMFEVSDSYKILGRQIFEINSAIIPCVNLTTGTNPLTEIKMTTVDFTKINSILQDIEETLSAKYKVYPTLEFNESLFLDGQVNKYANYYQPILGGSNILLLNDQIAKYSGAGGSKVAPADYFDYKQLNRGNNNTSIQESRTIGGHKIYELHTDENNFNVSKQGGNKAYTVVFCDFESLMKQNELFERKDFKFYILNNKPVFLVDTDTPVFKDNGIIEVNELTNIIRPDIGITTQDTVNNVTKNDNLKTNVDVGFTKIKPSPSIDTNIVDSNPLSRGGVGADTIETVNIVPDRTKGVKENLHQPINKEYPEMGRFEDVIVSKNINNWDSSIFDSYYANYFAFDALLYKELPFEKFTNNDTIENEDLTFEMVVNNLCLVDKSIIYETMLKELNNDNSLLEYKTSGRNIISTKMIRVDTLKRDLYDNIQKYDIIDYIKGFRDTTINETIMKYHRVLKVAKPFWKFVPHIGVATPDKLLFIDPEEMLQYGTEHPELMLDDETSLSQKFKPYNLIEDTEETLEKVDQGHEFEVNIDEPLFGFRPVGSPQPFDMIRVVKSLIKDLDTEQKFVFFWNADKDTFYVCDITSLETEMKNFGFVEDSIYVIGGKRNLTYDDLNEFLNTNMEVSVHPDNHSNVSHRERATTNNIGDSYISHDPRETQNPDPGLKVIHNARPVGERRMDERFLMKNAYQTYIENKFAFGKMIQKRAHKMGIAKDIAMAARTGQPTYMFNELRFVMREGRQVNEHFVDLAIERAHIKFGVRNDTIWPHINMRVTETHEEPIFTMYNRIQIRPKETYGETRAFFVYKVNDHNIASMNDLWVKKRYDNKSLMFESDQWIDIRKTIWEYNHLEPMVRCGAPGTKFDPLSIIDMKKRQPFWNEFSNFIFQKDYTDTIIPQMMDIMNDSIVRDILLEDFMFIDRVDEPQYFKTVADTVDELLLPHNDFNYEKFQTGLVDTTTGRPKKVVSVVDDKTFICTYPVNHPLPEMSGFANEYVAIDVQLMRFLLEVYYSIWQKNIFKFGGMSLRDAVAKMLEYMQVFVEYRIPEMLQAQANRVIRLIRWYGEYAILEKSEYKVHVEFEPLKSNMHLGTCMIPNQMENMMVNLTKFILTNINTSNDASIEFYLNNPVDTVINFMPVISGGHLEVYINGELIDTIVVSKSKVEYNLTKGSNTIKLWFKNSDNGMINIANIVINDYTFKGLTTEFSPKVGTGNIALNDVIKRATVYAESLENSQEFVQQVIDGNLAIGELVDKLIEYFEKHHAQKSKGKRLTVKK